MEAIWQFLESDIGIILVIDALACMVIILAIWLWEMEDERD